MPVDNPIKGVYVQNTTQSAAITHNTAVAEGKFVGVAVKQKTRSWKDGYSVQRTIDDDEYYYLITKGEVQVANTGISSANKGDAVYITSANALTTTSTGNLRFGRITEIASTNGVPAAKVRIDLDDKSAVSGSAF